MTHPSGRERVEYIPTNWNDMLTSRFQAKEKRLPTGIPSTQTSSGPRKPPGVMTVVSQYGGVESRAAAS